MKKLLLSAVLLFAAFFSNGQDCKTKAITLTSDNVNLKSGTIHEHSASIKKVKLPATGAGKTWDYSGLSGGSAITYGYVKNKSKDFSKSAVVDTGQLYLFDNAPDPTDTYPGSTVYDEDDKGLFMAGHTSPNYWTADPPPAASGDGILITNQTDKTSSRVNVIKFPATNNSSWSSKYSQTLKWTLTLAELGWSDINCTEVTYTTVSDKVVGYGDVKIPAAKKNDKNDFNALMVQHSVLTSDSIFVGAVANDYNISYFFGSSLGIYGWPLGYPTSQHQVDQYTKVYGSDYVNAIISIFGTAIDPYGLFVSNSVSQGMVTVNDNSEIFYTTDAFRPAITFDFGSDNTFSTLTSIVYNTDIEGNGDDEGSVQAVVPFLNGTSNDNESASAMNAGTNNIAQLSVYPNPLANSSSLNCSMVKNTDATWMLNIMNMTGQIVESIPVTAKGNLNIPVQIKGNLRSGLYLMNAIDENGRPVGTTKLNVIASSF